MSEFNQKGFRDWLKLVLTIFLPPVLILFLGVAFLLELKLDARLKEFESQSHDQLEKLALASKTQRYISAEIARIFSSTKKPKFLKKKIEDFLADHGLKADFLIWRRNGSVFYSSFKLDSWPGDWKKAYYDLLDFNARKYGSESKVPVGVYYNLRRIFGPHFFPRYFHRSHRASHQILLRNDASLKSPALWLQVAPKGGLAVFFDHDIFTGYPGVERMLASHKDQKLNLGVLLKEKILASDENFRHKLESFKETLRYNFQALRNVGDYYFVSHFIDENLIGISSIKRKSLEKDLISRQMTLACILALLLIILLMYKSYLLLVREQKLRMMLKSQLLLLFLFANVLPGYIISVISYDYLQQYRAGLLNSAYLKGMSYLRDIDGLYENEFTNQKIRLEKGLAKLGVELKNNGVSGRGIRDFMSLQQPYPYRLFLVGSSTVEVVTNEAIMRNGKVIDLINEDFLRGPHKKQQMHAIEKIGKFFLALLNHKPISAKMGTEVEILADALSQQQPVELMQEFFQRDGGFWNWGVGSKSHPAYICLLKLRAEDIFDYLFIYLWHDNELQLNFMNRSFERFARNDSSIRVMAVNESSNKSLPPKLLKNEKLKSFAMQLHQKSTRKFDYCFWEGVRYLLFGLKCNQLTHFRLLGMIPVEDIDARVEEKMRLLLGLALVSLLVTISLGMFVAGSVLEPLSELQKGISALRERRFAYRLPDLGTDEFGHLAEIFNNTLIDLEEMHTASTFKEKILTNSDDLQNCANFEIFARTINFANAGGDYLEVLLAEDDGPDRIVLGDVAGSGIAAILILAFVKSALLQLQHLSNQPAKLVEELERLFKISSRSGQRRFMAFQYLTLHAEKGEIEMVNAGMFFPIIFDCLKKTFEQVRMPSRPLGAGSTVAREVHKIEISSNQALVLFSNGVLAGGRIEHQAVLEILHEVEGCTAKGIFDEFAQEFSRRYGQMMNDDVTMVVIRRIEKRIVNGTTESV
jgi:HAMP domain-containing protein